MATNPEGVGTHLSHRDERSHTGQVTGESHLSQLGHSLYRQAGLCAASSGSGPIRAAVLLGILQTPHRFRTKRPLWNYGGLAIEMHSSADHRRVDGQLQRSRKNVLVRGLNRNCNHDLKNLFKSAAAVASSKPGPFQEFYIALLAKGVRPEMARLTLARKIATIVLIVWKRGVCFDAQHLKPQTA
jgi:transposase